MNTTPQSPFKQQTVIPYVEFERELEKKGAFSSPLFNGISDPRQAARVMYGMILDAGHSAEIWLAIAGREHSWGTNPNSVLHRNDTRSWTNARSIRKPGLSGTIITDAVRKSQYVRYENVIDSLADGIYRVDDPTFSYATATTIAEVIRVWAPAEDSNDPEGYAWFVANYVTGLRSRLTDPILGGDSDTIPWIPADDRHHTKGRTVQWPDLLAWHHTDGWDSLAWLTTSPNSNVSSTYLLNHDGSIRAQLVRHEDTPHTSGALYNPRTLSFEWERKWPEQRDISDAQYRRIARSGARAWLRERARGNPHFQGLPERKQLIGHNQVSSTTCPGNLDITRIWQLMREELRAPAPDALILPGNPYGAVPVVLGFRELITSQGTHRHPSNPHAGILSLFGYPQAPERATPFGSEQPFERCVLRWYRDTPQPWDIVLQLREGG